MECQQSTLIVFDNETVAVGGRGQEVRYTGDEEMIDRVQDSLTAGQPLSNVGQHHTSQSSIPIRFQQYN